MEFLVVLALVRGDRLAGPVAYGEAQFALLRRIQARGEEVEGVAAFGDLEPSGR